RASTSSCEILVLIGASVAVALPTDPAASPGALSAAAGAAAGAAAAAAAAGAAPAAAGDAAAGALPVSVAAAGGGAEPPQPRAKARGRMRAKRCMGGEEKPGRAGLSTGKDLRTRKLAPQRQENLTEG